MVKYRYKEHVLCRRRKLHCGLENFTVASGPRGCRKFPFIRGNVVISLLVGRIGAPPQKKVLPEMFPSSFANLRGRWAPKQTVPLSVSPSPFLSLCLSLRVETKSSRCIRASRTHAYKCTMREELTYCSPAARTPATCHWSSSSVSLCKLLAAKQWNLETNRGPSDTRWNRADFWLPRGAGEDWWAGVRVWNFALRDNNTSPCEGRTRVRRGDG